MDVGKNIHRELLELEHFQIFILKIKHSRIEQNNETPQTF